MSALSQLGYAHGLEGLGPDVRYEKSAAYMEGWLEAVDPPACSTSFSNDGSCPICGEDDDHNYNCEEREAE